MNNSLIIGILILLGAVAIIVLSNLILNKFNNDKTKKGAPYGSMIGSFISLTLGIVFAIEIICKFIKIK